MKQVSDLLPSFANGIVRTMLFVFAFLITGASAVFGQKGVDDSQTHSTARNEWGVFGSFSFDSPTVIGKTPNARFDSLTLRYARTLASSKDFAFQWTVDAVPASVLSVDRLSVTTGPSGPLITTTRQRTYAAGLSPLGLKLNFRPDNRLVPFVSATGGFLYFAENVPLSGATQFNYTFDFGGGVEIRHKSRGAFTLGYKYQHISNGGRSTVNPGVDLQLIYLGYSIRR